MPSLAPPEFATPSELLLLRSALLEGPPAAKSVKSWFSSFPAAKQVVDFKVWQQHPGGCSRWCTETSSHPFLSHYAAS